MSSVVAGEVRMVWCELAFNLPPSNGVGAFTSMSLVYLIYSHVLRLARTFTVLAELERGRDLRVSVLLNFQMTCF